MATTTERLATGSELWGQLTKGFDVEIGECEVKERGRGLYAKRDFKKNEVLFRELPFVYLPVSRESSETLPENVACCGYCLRPRVVFDIGKSGENQNNEQSSHLIADIIEGCNSSNCSSCKQTYCSDQCRKLHLKRGHKELCSKKTASLPSSSSSSSSSSFSSTSSVFKGMYTRLISRLIARLLYTLKNDSMEGFLNLWQVLEDLYHLKAEDVMISSSSSSSSSSQSGLLPSTEYATIKALFCRDPMDHYLLNGVPILTPEGWIHLCSVLLLNCYGVDVSPVVWRPGCDEADAERIGGRIFVRGTSSSSSSPVPPTINPNPTFFNLALCTIASYINHSCIPNVRLRDVGGRRESLALAGRHRGLEVSGGAHNLVEVVAMKDIAKGEEIVTSYLPLDLPLNRRREELSARYSFVCDCSLCKQEQEQTKKS